MPLKKVVEPEPETEPAEAPAEAPAKAPAKASKREVRHTVNSWWCPDDDTAMPSSMAVCVTCGYKR